MVKIVSKLKKSVKKSARAVRHVEATKAQKDYEVWRASLDVPNAPPHGNVSTTADGHSVKSPALMEAILNYLRKGYVPKLAAEAVGISRTTAFKWRSEDPEFAQRWEQAVDEGTDLLEAAILKRARDGVSRPVFQQGEAVGFTQEYSDSLAAMMLQGRRPMYRKQQPDDGGNSGVTINIHGGLPAAVTLTDAMPRVNVVESKEEKKDDTK